jgi:hypothetical protein
MFDSLDDQMKADLDKESTSTERMIRYAAVAVASVLIFGGLVYGVRYLD